jgi:hypothetical protein
MRWHVMITMAWYVDEHIETLLDRKDVKPFYKVVNIIQGQLLRLRVIYYILFYYKSPLLLR